MKRGNRLYISQTQLKQLGYNKLHTCSSNNSSRTRTQTGCLAE